MEQAIAAIAEGRHAPGTRQLRQVGGSLARRGAWSEAAHGALALAEALLRRGRTRDALAVIADGRQEAPRAGQAWIDLGPLDEADSVLGTALAPARELAQPDRIAAASLGLARAAYW